MVRKIPVCIGIILDGNRRWARARGLPTFAGHKKGFENFMDAAYWIRDAGASHFVVYAFSTENWNRTPKEVSYLMTLFLRMATTQLTKLIRAGMRVRFVGQRERLSIALQKAFAIVEEKSKHNTGFTIWICLSYGGRAEIVEAAEKLRGGRVPITEESLRNQMWTAEMPDPDLIIRTSGEHRLSGFLTWASVYSELFFIKPHWPAFTKKDLEKILKEYAARERRMGK